MTKFSIASLFIVAATQSPAQYFQDRCCASPVTPAQMDSWYQGSSFFSNQPYLESAPSGELISAARLRHKPPRSARTAFFHGLKLDKTGAYPAAAVEFANATALDPEFSEAHGNLGVEYTAMGRLDEAVSEFRRALTLDPATSFHHSNLAYTLIRLRRDKEAEDEAQAALALDPTSGIAHFLLGVVLVQHPEKRNLVETHLITAARTFPLAHLVLAQVYRYEGAIETANAELQRYRQASQPVVKNHSGDRQAFLPRY